MTSPTPSRVYRATPSSTPELTRHLQGDRGPSPKPEAPRGCSPEGSESSLVSYTTISNDITTRPTTPLSADDNALATGPNAEPVRNRRFWLPTRVPMHTPVHSQHTYIDGIEYPVASPLATLGGQLERVGDDSFVLSVPMAPGLSPTNLPQVGEIVEVFLAHGIDDEADSSSESNLSEHESGPEGPSQQSLDETWDTAREVQQALREMREHPYGARSEPTRVIPHSESQRELALRYQLDSGEIPVSTTSDSDSESDSGSETNSDITSILTSEANLQTRLESLLWDALQPAISEAVEEMMHELYHRH
ncbi:hypothetical protein CERSUDRAFT_100973 [Gelatoporia subvermispora B]|uniref:Uncharacterized protein n=1 Tax=Ceriporiopsis subvermispora (strain B) TaxID=914234 RepID=M2QFL4_CERS8|nr:hypothetical protein CERSUDRAFT_100973 [Gelatoporia subvermispora B]